MRDGLQYRKNIDSTWQQDGMCLTADDAQQVVSHYRHAYSTIRFEWLMDQAYCDSPFEDCREVFNAARNP